MKVFSLGIPGLGLIGKMGLLGLDNHSSPSMTSKASTSRSGVGRYQQRLAISAMPSSIPETAGCANNRRSQAKRRDRAVAHQCSYESQSHPPSRQPESSLSQRRRSRLAWDDPAALIAAADA